MIHCNTALCKTAQSRVHVHLQREAEREAARLSAIRDAEKRAYEETEAKAAAELQQRVEVEQKTIAEQQQRARAELERQRRCVVKPHLVAISWVCNSSGLLDISSIMCIEPVGTVL